MLIFFKLFHRQLALFIFCPCSQKHDRCELVWKKLSCWNEVLFFHFSCWKMWKTEKWTFSHMTPKNDFFHPKLLGMLGVHTGIIYIWFGGVTFHFSNFYVNFFTFWKMDITWSILHIFAPNSNTSLTLCSTLVPYHYFKVIFRVTYLVSSIFQFSVRLRFWYPNFEKFHRHPFWHITHHTGRISRTKCEEKYHTFKTRWKSYLPLSGAINSFSPKEVTRYNFLRQTFN